MTTNSDIGLWHCLSSYSNRRVLFSGKKLDIVEYAHRITGEDASLTGLTGKKLLFLSDLHWAEDANIASELIEGCSNIAPEWIVFGGDIASYFDSVAPALEMLSHLKARLAKVAVLGNWDRKWHRTFPVEKLKSEYKKIGFELLINAPLESENIFFYGTDDFKSGKPIFPDTMPPSLLPIIVSHNPDTIVDFANQDILLGGSTSCKPVLALCGHTHAGQIRIPLFGALKTSSNYWKKFEYGLFEHQKNKTKMVVSSGIGKTLLPIRFMCRPEMVVINFT